MNWWQKWLEQNTLEVRIAGGGESGVGAAILAKKKGMNVWVSDSGKIKEEYIKVLLHHEIQFEEGGHSAKWLEGAELVIKSPGIPDEVEWVKKVKKQDVSVISEIEFGWRFIQGKTIAITGSNGKTTTTLLCGHLLRKGGLNVSICGNVGKSLAWEVAENESDIYVVELSSFQLDGIEEFKPHFAVLLNITPDHLDRYEYKLEKYSDSKARIFMNQDENDYLIYNADDPLITEQIKLKNPACRLVPFSQRHEEKNGAHIQGEQLIITINQKPLTMSIHNLALQGKHNLYNSMAAGIISRLFDLRKEVVRESMSDFQNQEHRLEKVGKVYGIEFINDSKATNVNSTWYALETMNHPVIWIAGGVDKGNDYEQLIPLVKEKVKAIICLGTDNSALLESFGDVVEHIYETKSCNEAVNTAYRLGTKGDVVLLSPACASFDLFENYEDRGRKFKMAVKSL